MRRGNRTAPSERRRKVGIRDVKKRVLAVVEGSKTEPQYLGLLALRRRDAAIEFQTVDEKATDPRSLVDRACYEKNNATENYKRSKDPNDKVDEVWCVFDVDQHPYLIQACQKANDHGIMLAISNPCFELWLLLHFQDQQRFLERDQARRELRNYVRGYEKKLLSLDALVGKLEIARHRAETLDRKHEGDGTVFPNNNPSSGIRLLIESLGVRY